MWLIDTIVFHLLGIRKNHLIQQINNNNDNLFSSPLVVTIM